MQRFVQTGPSQPPNVRDMSSGDAPIAVYRGCVTVQSVTVSANPTTNLQPQSTISACCEARTRDR